MKMRLHGWVTGYCLGYVLAGLLLTMNGCGGSNANDWTPKDSQSVRTTLQTQSAIIDFCSSDAGCDPGQVVVVETSNHCNIGSMAFRHGVIDAGMDGCTP
jgi:hypothetical protein